MIWIPPISVPPVVEWRARYEDRVNRDFNSAVADRRVDAPSRIRVGLPLQGGKEWSGFVQIQAAINPFWSPIGQRGTTNVDATNLYVRHTDNSKVVTLGRQRFAAGSERLFGIGEWTNLGRAYDGVRVQGKTWQAFAGTVGVSTNRPRNAKIALFASDSSAGKTFFLWKHDQVASGAVDIGTLSQSHAVRYGKWELDGEAALQMGRSQGRRHEAWALHAGAAYALTPATKVTLDLNAASGGRNANVVRTFDNLYPTNHRYYGTMDMQAWKNMNEVAVGVRHKFNNKLDSNLQAHFFSLRDARDSWYGASGGQNGGYVDPAGISGREIGTELDLELTYAIDSKNSVSAGIGVFMPGRFVKSFGTDDRQAWLYIQYTKR